MLDVSFNMVRCSVPVSVKAVADQVDAHVGGKGVTSCDNHDGHEQVAYAHLMRHTLRNKTDHR